MTTKKKTIKAWAVISKRNAQFICTGHTKKSAREDLLIGATDMGKKHIKEITRVVPCTITY